MLTHLQVTDFTLVKSLSLDFSKGLTALTGETGAGKSILLGALGLALGDRADADKVRLGASKAEVCASFDVGRLRHVKKWLNDADFGADECIIRRIVTAEGRSRAYINGQVVTLTQLRVLGVQLVDIHSQHEHQSLLNPQTHRRLLDGFGQLEALAKEVKQAYTAWQKLSINVARIQDSHEELNARYQLLSYQKDELDQLDVAVGECEALESKQKQLANAAEIQEASQHISDICYQGEGSIEEQLGKALQLINALPVKSIGLEQVGSMLRSSLIQVEEAASELQREMDTAMDEGSSLVEIEQRLTLIYDIARKHRVAPETLVDLHGSLTKELASIASGDDQLESFKKERDVTLVQYNQAAKRLRAERQKAGLKLEKAVNKQIVSLAMTHASFEVALNEQEAPGRYGSESPEFLISTIPGQPPKSLAKVASGGELSRISLSIQVVAAKTSVTPTIVFDEVDVGIGGETGDVVGRLLRTLGESTQALCVTHLAQVASKAHHHLKVEKTVTKKGASTLIGELSGEEKVIEIARMMGGVIESEQSIAHAREMLEV